MWHESRGEFVVFLKPRGTISSVYGWLSRCKASGLPVEQGGWLVLMTWSIYLIVYSLLRARVIAAGFNWRQGQNALKV